jgi:hypothetical protein
MRFGETALDWRRFSTGIVLTVFVELLLLAFFLIPQPYKDDMVLHRDHISVINLWTGHFVHVDTIHLLGNMALFAALAAFLLAVLAWQERLPSFRWLLGVNLLAVPPALSVVWIPMNVYLFPTVARSLGFSGVNAAFVGSFVLALAAHVCGRLGVGLRHAFMPLMMLALVPAALIASASLLVTTLVVAVAAGYSVYLIRIVLKNPGVGRGAFALCALLALPPLLSLLLFPLSLASDGSVVNIMIHYFGLVAGYVWTYLYFQRDIEEGAEVSHSSAVFGHLGRRRT